MRVRGGAPLGLGLALLCLAAPLACNAFRYAVEMERSVSSASRVDYALDGLSLAILCR